MNYKINKKEIIWGYLYHIFSVFSGIILLPIMLNILTEEEIGFNYIMLTIGAFVILLDFGFAPQFSRNFTYVFSGAQKLLKRGIDTEINNKSINYKLLFVMIYAAKFLYKRLALIVLLTLLVFGTFYINYITKGFTKVNNSLLIWLLYTLSVYFDVYFAYYSSLLNGKGLILEHRKFLVYSKLIYMLLALILLFSGFRLLSVVLANLVSVFVYRFLAYKSFFTIDFKTKINSFVIDNSEVREILNILWYNAKKIGLVYLGGFTVSKIGMLLAGLYLSLKEVASYGIMIQLVTLICVISTTFNTIYQPRISYLRTKNNSKALSEFAYTLVVFIMTFIVLSIIFCSIGQYAFALIGSSTKLPSLYILILYIIVMFLETHHSLFSSFIVTNNKVPFVKSTLIAGGAISILSYIVLKFSDMKIVGLVLVPGIVQLMYNDWKWPKEVCKTENIGYLNLLVLGCKTLKENIYKR